MKVDLPNVLALRVRSVICRLHVHIFLNNYISIAYLQEESSQHS